MTHKCFRCGTEFEGNFCPECGEKWQEEKTCPQCGKVLAGGVKFCNQCGYSFMTKPAQPAPVAQPAQTPVPATPPAVSAPNPAAAPARTTKKAPLSAEKRAAVFYAVCRYLPASLVALFSVLLFLFCIAPAAVMPGGELFGETLPSTSLGNVYAMLSNGAIPSLKGCCVALIVFGSLMLADGALFGLVWYLNKDFDAARPLRYLGYAFLFAVFVISCVMFGIVGKEDGGLGMLAVGAAPILILVFSLLFGALSATAFGIKIYMGRRRPEIRKSYENAVAARKEAQKARDRQYYETHPAPVEPKAKYGKPQKPAALTRRDTVPMEKRAELMPEMERHIKRKRTLASFLLLIPLGIILPLALLVWSRECHIKGWHPEKVYKYKSLLAGIITYAVIFILFAIFGIIVTILAISSDRLSDERLLNAGIGIIICIISIGIFIIIIVSYRKTAEQRILLCRKLYGGEHPKNNITLVVNYKRDQTQYNADCLAYKENRRAWTIYSYQVARYNKRKPYDSYEMAKYPRVWCYVHRKLLAVCAVVLAGIITLTCVLATIDWRFSADNLMEIGLGGAERRVEDVLGEPDVKSDTIWYYYSKNYVSILEDMQELEERAKQTSSFEEIGKLKEEYNELQKELNELEHKEIIVQFSSSSHYTSRLILDTCAVDGKTEEKTVKEVTLSSDTYRRSSSLSYAITYEDGSYYAAYFSAFDLPASTGSHQTITWSNEWGTYSADIDVRS